MAFLSICRSSGLLPQIIGLLPRRAGSRGGGVSPRTVVTQKASPERPRMAPLCPVSLSPGKTTIHCLSLSAVGGRGGECPRGQSSTKRQSPNVRGWHPRRPVSRVPGEKPGSSTRAPVLPRTRLRGGSSVPASLFCGGARPAVGVFWGVMVPGSSRYRGSKRRTGRAFWHFTLAKPNKTPVIGPRFRRPGWPVKAWQSTASRTAYRARTGRFARMTHNLSACLRAGPEAARLEKLSLTARSNAYLPNRGPSRRRGFGSLAGIGGSATSCHFTHWGPLFAYPATIIFGFTQDRHDLIMTFMAGYVARALKHKGS
jgi:hypothetical protein